MTHNVTPETQKLVMALASVGIPETQIASQLEVCRNTLRKHYTKELQDAAVQKNYQVAEALFQNCIKGNVTAQIFWAKTRMHWRETDREEITEDGKVGKIQIEVIKSKGETSGSNNS